MQSSGWILGVLQLGSSYIAGAVAKPLSTGLELRIPKNLGLDPYPLNAHLNITVHEVVLPDHDILPYPEYNPNSATTAILNGLVVMQRQKREASIINKNDDSKNRRAILSDNNRKCKKKKKNKLCDGIYKMVWNAITRQCEACPEGQKPSEKGDKCIVPETPEEEKERGKCPQGQKLDPSIPGQDATTNNPKCVDKNQQNKCPAGQSESTPTKSKPPKCAPDNEPDKRCQNSDQYVHKEIAPDGKIKKSCRLTREAEKKKVEKTGKNMKDAGDRATEQRNKEAEKRRDRQNRARSRRAACLALGAMTFIPEPDVEALSMLEVEGLIEPDDNSHVPNIQIEDYMVTITGSEHPTVDETAAAGWGALLKSLVRFFKSGGPAGGAAANRPTIPLQKGARLFGGTKKGPGSGGSLFAKLRKKDSDLNNKPASTAAKEAASKSETVKNILKSKTFQECVAFGAGGTVAQVAGKRAENSYSDLIYESSYGAGFTLTIDLAASTRNNRPSPEENDNILLFIADEYTDGGADESPDFHRQTYQDGYNRLDRLYYEACGRVPFGVNNKITLLQTWNGCCKYYNGEDCEPETGLFKQTDREDGQLDGDHNDVVSSYWCSFDPNCTGAPGG